MYLTNDRTLDPAVNFCKRFEPRSGFKLFDTYGIFLKEFFEKVHFAKKIVR